MELRYLETVLAVAEYLSFSRAAEEIPCSQASVSRQISTVEHELGYTIFERKTKSGSVQLTARGKKVLDRIRTIVSLSNELFDQEEGLGSAVFRLGLFAGPFSLIARSRIVSQAYITCPELHLVISDVMGSEIHSGLSQMKYDGVLAYDCFLEGEQEAQTSLLQRDRMNFEFIKTQHLRIAVPKSHPLASRQEVSFGELRDETFLIERDILKENVTVNVHRGFLKNCEKCGFTPKIATLGLPMMEFANLRDTAIAEHGWVYPTFKSDVLHDNTDVVLVPVNDAIYYSEYVFITREGRQTQKSVLMSKCLRELLNR